jgi:ribosome-associated translation inhibitor RaiA
VIVPLQVLFQNTQPIEKVETRIRQELAELEKFYNHIVSCQVDVEVPEHQRRGSVSKIRIDLGVSRKHAVIKPEPSSPETKQAAQHLEVKAEHKDVSMAVHAAFNTAHRRLEDFTGR